MKHQHFTHTPISREALIGRIVREWNTLAITVDTSGYDSPGTVATGRARAGYRLSAPDGTVLLMREPEEGLNAFSAAGGDIEALLGGASVSRPTLAELRAALADHAKRPPPEETVIELAALNEGAYQI